MSTAIVYRSKSASFAANRVAKAASGLRAVQEDSYRHQDGDTAIVRWDCFERLEGQRPHGVLDLNPALSVVQCRDKAESRRLLGELAPPTWFTRPDVQLPCVIRPRKHKAGNHFYVCRTPLEVEDAIRRCRAGWYASRLIDKAREFRVFIVQGRVVAVSERFGASAAEIAWNLARGGRLINVARQEWPVPVLKASIEAMRRIGLGFGAVDACIDTANRVFIFEVNTSPALKNKFTIKQIGRALAEVDKEVPAVKAGAKRWKSYIHPALGGSSAIPQAPSPSDAINRSGEAPNPEVGTMPRVILPTPSAINFADLVIGQPFIFEEGGEQRLGIKARANFLDYRDTPILREWSNLARITRIVDTLRAE